MMGLPALSLVIRPVSFSPKTAVRFSEETDLPSDEDAGGSVADVAIILGDYLEELEPPLASPELPFTSEVDSGLHVVQPQSSRLKST